MLQGLAAATNDLNAVSLGGVVNPLDASISDSVVIAGPGKCGEERQRGRGRGEGAEGVGGGGGGGRVKGQDA